jgi:hypothetical protein
VWQVTSTLNDPTGLGRDVFDVEDAGRMSEATTSTGGRERRKGTGNQVDSKSEETRKTRYRGFIYVCRLGKENGRIEAMTESPCVIGVHETENGDNT